MSDDKVLLPVLKWAGGKRWLSSSHPDLFPKNFNRYIEPFLGGGAVFFHLHPKKAVLGDLNADLIAFYEVLRDDWENLVSRLRQHHKKHSNSYYYQIRSSRPTSKVGKAAKFLYLNRTCFNGLYRVNLKGEFNVPIGSKTWVISEDDDFESLANALSGARLVQSDFQGVVAQARKGDLLYVDPPYTVQHNFNNFIKYNEKLFSWEDQKRLRDSLFDARDRGVHVVLSNADHESIRKLYAGFGEKVPVERSSKLAADASKRRSTTELVFRTTY